ncbi:TPA: SMI1/KNR4 family protein, partial [Pasteurella multocida]|nr:SMI1/KNR4 family protein [Pasteurella multocida]
MKFRTLDIRYDMGAVDDAQISNFEKMFKITLPRLYIELIRNHNALRVAQDYFDYYDSYRKEESLCSFGFDGFETEE